MKIKTCEISLEFECASQRQTCGLQSVYGRESLYICRQFSSLAALWTFIPIVVCKETIGHWKVSRCQNESNVLRRKRKPVVENDIENKGYDMIF